MNKKSSFYQFWASVVCAALALPLLACRQNETANSSEGKTTEITVSAAASLQNAFREIAAVYEKRSGVKINFNFAASGALQKQIEQGAPVDVFASAGKTQMDALAAKDLIVAESRRDFARNELILIAPAAAETKTAGFVQFLETPNIRLAIGNPKTVPAGQYAEQSLKNANVWDGLQNRLVFGEDVRQVLDYVARGEADAGIVYVSDARAAGDRVREIARAPENSHDPIFYPIAVVKNSSNKTAAAAFVEIVLSSEGQEILQKHGFQQFR